MCVVGYDFNQNDEASTGSFIDIIDNEDSLPKIRHFHNLFTHMSFQIRKVFFFMF